MTVNYRYMLLLAALFMGSLAVMTAIQGYAMVGTTVVIFEFVAAALLLYWAVV